MQVSYAGKASKERYSGLGKSMTKTLLAWKKILPLTVRIA
jgi:hypothetical protein